MLIPSMIYRRLMDPGETASGGAEGESRSSQAKGIGSGRNTVKCAYAHAVGATRLRGESLRLQTVAHAAHCSRICAAVF